MSQIILNNLSVQLNDNLIIKNLHFQTEAESFVAIVGKSGSGKTTLLKTMARLLPYSGTMIIPHHLSLIFQEFSVFPWLTVENNIALGIKETDAGKRQDIIEEHLRLTNLDNKRECYPAELSGGQIQRVAIARSLAYDPAVLLMDEPFSALDSHTRDQMQEWLLDIWTKKQKTVIFVTHNIEEAIYLSDYVYIFKQKRLTECIKIPFPRPRPSELKFSEEFNKLKKEITYKID